MYSSGISISTDSYSRSESESLISDLGIYDSFNRSYRPSLGSTSWNFSIGTDSFSSEDVSDSKFRELYAVSNFSNGSDVSKARFPEISALIQEQKKEVDDRQNPSERFGKCIDDAVIGYSRCNGNIISYTDDRIFTLTTRQLEEKKVKVVSGGSWMMGDCVGRGMLACAIVTNMAAPKPSVILRALQLLWQHDTGSGILAIIPNNVEDRICWGIALAKAQREQITVEPVFVGDDAWSYIDGPGNRGLPGLILYFKIGGGMAEERRSLREVKERLRGLSVASIGCHINCGCEYHYRLLHGQPPPGHPRDTFSLMGQHRHHHRRHHSHRHGISSSAIVSTYQKPMRDSSQATNFSLGPSRLFSEGTCIGSQLDARETTCQHCHLVPGTLPVHSEQLCCVLRQLFRRPPIKPQGPVSAVKPFTEVCIGTDMEGEGGRSILVEDLKHLTREMISYLVDPELPSSLGYEPDTCFVLLVNMYKGRLVNLFNLTSKVTEHLSSIGINVLRIYSGHFVRSKEGFSITLLSEADNDIVRWLDEYADCSDWTTCGSGKGVKVNAMAKYQLVTTTPYICSEDLPFVESAVKSACAALIQQREDLNLLDPEGVYGTRMATLAETVQGMDFRYPSTFLARISELFTEVFPKSEGSMMGLLFSSAALRFRQFSDDEIPVTLEMWVEALSRGVKAIKAFSKVKVGQSTPLDILAPVSRRLSSALLHKKDLLKVLEETIRLTEARAKSNDGEKRIGKGSGGDKERSMTLVGTCKWMGGLVFGLREKMPSVEVVKELTIVELPPPNVPPPLRDYSQLYCSSVPSLHSNQPPDESLLSDRTASADSIDPELPSFFMNDDD